MQILKKIIFLQKENHVRGDPNRVEGNLAVHLLGIRSVSVLFPSRALCGGGWRCVLSTPMVTNYLRRLWQEISTFCILKMSVTLRITQGYLLSALYVRKKSLTGEWMPEDFSPTLLKPVLSGERERNAHCTSFWIPGSKSMIFMLCQDFYRFSISMKEQRVLWSCIAQSSLALYFINKRALLHEWASWLWLGEEETQSSIIWGWMLISWNYVVFTERFVCSDAPRCFKQIILQRAF